MKTFVLLGAFFGALGVCLGAFAAHALRESLSAQDLDAEYEPDVPPPVEEGQEEPKLSPKDPKQQIKELDDLCEQLKELKEYLENKHK